MERYYWMDKEGGIHLIPAAKTEAEATKLAWEHYSEAWRAYWKSLDIVPTYDMWQDVKTRFEETTSVGVLDPDIGPEAK